MVFFPRSADSAIRLLVVFALSPVPETLEAEVGAIFASIYLILPSLTGLGRS
jgi:hypothetical protein